jgi:ubiquinone/menaquinone biosynthesis C-methylase UbiE
VKPEWQSYDSAAAAHDQLAVPTIFERPARELVARIGVTAGSIVLDVGTGTGVAALAAAESAAVVVGLDPSVEMLRKASSHGLACVVAGMVPGLPFAQSTFDRVIANFVITHVASYRDSLADMVRVLKPGGKLGVTAWGSVENEFRVLWKSLVGSFVEKDRLAAAVQEALPWEDWFTDPGHLKQALHEAGLAAIHVDRTEYTTRQTIAEFLALRENSLQGRFARQVLGADRWEEFRQTMTEEFDRRFKNPIEYARDFYVAVAQVS